MDIKSQIRKILTAADHPMGVAAIEAALPGSFTPSNRRKVVSSTLKNWADTFEKIKGGWVSI